MIAGRRSGVESGSATRSDGVIASAEGERFLMDSTDCALGPGMASERIWTSRAGKTEAGARSWRREQAFLKS